MLKTAQTNLEGGVINLGVGHPSLQMLPLREMGEAAAHRFAQGNAEFLQYGYEWGDGYLRAELAQFLSSEYRLTLSPEELFISGGVSQALDLACAMLTQPGDTVIVEDPTYFFSFNIFRNHGLNIVSCPLDDQGLRIDALRELVEKYRPKLLYTIPVHQNPAGVTLSQERREAVMSLAQEYGFYVLADEVYQLLTFAGQGPRSFAAWAETGLVLSLGSFSKILAPGTRLGWIYARADLLECLAQNGMIVSGGGFSPLGSGVVRSMLELGLLPRYLEGLRHTLGTRAAALAQALQAHAPLLQFQPAQGGYFIWAQWPGGQATELLPLALERGVRFQPGPLFSAAGTQTDRLRLCFAFYEEPELREGARRLGQALTRA